MKSISAKIVIQIDGIESHSIKLIRSTWADLIVAVTRFLIGAKDYTEDR